jgi:hypothetical protein
MPQIAPTSTSIRPLRRSLAVSALAAMLLAAALATPAAGYHAYLDLRSPDARDAARPAEAPQDLRSPDARDAVYPPAAYQDLRSPDARDAGSPMPQAPPARRLRRTTSPGDTWRSAALG